MPEQEAQGEGGEHLQTPSEQDDYPPPSSEYPQGHPGYQQPQPGYPPPHPGYQQPQPGYPPHPGVPPQGYAPPPYASPQGYPPPGTPPSGYPPPGYPPPHPGYPPPHPGYPPTGQSAPQSEPWAPGSGFDPTRAPVHDDGWSQFASNGAGSHPAGTEGSEAKRTSGSRRAILVVVSIILLVGLLAGGGVALFAGGSSSSSPAAKAALTKALDAATKASSFHYVSVTTGASQDATTIGDASSSSGEQQITTTDANGTGHFTVIVFGKQCFFKGNALAMEENLNVDSTAAQAHADQWISLSPSDSPYASVYAAVTTHDALHDSITLRPQSLGTTTVDGKTVQTISGPVTPVTVAGQTESVKGTATLEVSQDTHRPLRYSQSGTLQGQKTTFTMTFSRYGQPVSVTPPVGAVTFPSIGGASGGNGNGGGSGSTTSPSILTSFAD